MQGRAGGDSTRVTVDLRVVQPGEEPIEQFASHEGANDFNEQVVPGDLSKDETLLMRGGLGRTTEARLLDVLPGSNRVRKELDTGGDHEDPDALEEKRW